MNKFCKALVPFVLVVALLVASMPAFAATSPTTKVITKVTVPSTTYTGKKQTPKITVYDKAGKKVNSKYYTTKISGCISAGLHKVVVTGKAPYTGKKKVWWTIKQAKNPFTIKAGRTTFRRNVLVDQTASIKVTGVKGGVKPRWTTSNSKVYVKDGKIIVKRGFSGTAKLSVTTGETANYLQTKKSVTITVRK